MFSLDGRATERTAGTSCCDDLFNLCTQRTNLRGRCGAAEGWCRLVELFDGVCRKKEASPALFVSDSELPDFEVDGGPHGKAGCEGEQGALGTLLRACEPGELLFEEQTQGLQLLLLEPQRRGLFAPLNEEKFFAERDKFNASKEEEKQIEEQINGRDEVVKRDYYFDEILNITVDYLNLIDNRRIAARVN